MCLDRGFCKDLIEAERTHASSALVPKIQTLQTQRTKGENACKVLRDAISDILQLCSVYKGPFVSALEYAVDCKAMVVGKPEKTFFTEAMKGFTCEAHEIVMVGDVSPQNFIFIRKVYHTLSVLFAGVDLFDFSVFPPRAG